VLLDVLGSVLDGFDLLGVFIRNLEVEGLFELHDQLNHVERIGSQIFLEGGAWGYFCFIYLQLLDNDLFNFFFNRRHACLLVGSFLNQPIKPVRCKAHQRLPRSLKSTEAPTECKGKQRPGTGTLDYK
jgi:hypothetical protein